MMKARLTVNGKQVTATLADNPTARHSASLLPITVQMRDLFGREKVGALPHALNEHAREFR